MKGLEMLQHWFWDTRSLWFIQYIMLYVFDMILIIENVF